MESSQSDDLFQRIASLLAEKQGYPRVRITAATRLAEDAGMDGDDAWEFLEAYAQAFDVDLAPFKFYHHFGSEGLNPLWLLFPPWWKRVQHVPLTMQHLVDAARVGRWILEYPDDPHYREADLRTPGA